MKNVFKFFVPMAAAVIAFASCVEENPIATPEANTLKISVLAVPDELQGEPKEIEETKTYISGSSILWGTGEYMKIGVNNGTTTSFANSTDETANIYSGQGVAKFDFSVSIDGSEFTYYGLYPASAAVASSNTNPANYKVNLPSTQNASANSYDPKAYILVAKPESGKTTASTPNEADYWQAAFRRATALNKVTLKDFPNGESIKRVTITAPSGKYLAGARHIDLTTGLSGDIYNGGGHTETVEVKYATALSGSGEGTWNADIWFTSWDAVIETGETLTIVAYTTSQKSYTKVITVPSNKSIKFQEGCLNTLGATGFNSITPENATELEEGDYLILANNNGTYYALKAEAEGTRMNYEDYSGSTSSFAGAADLVWSIAKTANGCYSIANDGKFLGFSGTKNTATLDAAGESWTTDNYEMDIIWDTNHYTVAVHSDDTRILAKNTNSQYGFAFYTGSGYNNIIFVPATVDNRAAVSLTFDNDQVDLTPAQAAGYLGEDLTVSPDVAAINQHLNWSYEDNDGIIDEFDNGALTLTGDEGTATVTVSFAGDDNYLPASASYTITVAAASVAEPEWVETAIGDLTSSDVFVMVANGAYALSSAGGTSTNPPAVSVTVSGTKLTGDIADAIKWNISGNSTNGFTFYPNGETTKLFCNTNASSSSNTNLRVGAGGNYNRYLFVLDSDHLKTNDEYTDRYIGINGTSDFRGYVSASTNSCTFKFYKYVAAQDNRQEAGMSWSADNATATYSNGNSLSFTAPNLTAGNATNITYESTDETIATINASGVVTITALSNNDVKVGDATIKAVFAGDPNYKPQTVSYTLTIVDSRTAIATPTFSPAAGEVAANTTVNFQCTDSGVTYHYTVDGSDPTVESATATSVTIDAAKTVKVLATKTGYKPSAVATAAYTIAGAQANDGSLEHPYTASEARTLALGGDTGSYYITGIVTKIQNQYSASFGTANFWIDENGSSQTVFEGYKIKYFGNQSWVEGNAEIALNDEVIIYGTLTVYNSTTPETSSGYLVSLNGTTKGLTLAAPTITTNTANSAKEITVAWTAATGTDSAVSYVVTCGSQNYNATAAGSHTFTMNEYGIYSVSVSASASDAISAVYSTSTTLADPNADSKTYTITFAKGTTFTTNQTGYTGSFVNTCDGLELTLSAINNGGNSNWTEMRAGRNNNNASVATITSNAAIPEKIKTVTLHVTQVSTSLVTSAKLIVSANSNFTSASESSFNITGTGDVSATVATPAANMYYKIEISLAAGSSNGHFRFDKIIYTTN